MNDIAYRAVVLSVAVMLCGASAAARAQSTTDDAPRIEVEEFDIRKAINDYFVDRLSFGWWADPPEKQGQGFRIVINIPVWWEGNPAAAMIALCPDRRNRIWAEAKYLFLQPFYRKLPWAGYECRI